MILDRHSVVLSKRLRDEFYLDEEAIRMAIGRGRPFNLIHLGTGVKIDIFPRGNRHFDQLELDRSVEVLLGTPPRSTPVKSPEDTVLRKLEWYRQGGEVSERQWSDVLGVIKTQAEKLDLAYLREQANALEVCDLLSAALDSVSS